MDTNLQLRHRLERIKSLELYLSDARNQTNKLTFEKQNNDLLE